MHLLEDVVVVGAGLDGQVAASNASDDKLKAIDGPPWPALDVVMRRPDDP